ncbi:unnamed protein product, partial [Prorocentrum cordatum]
VQTGIGRHWHSKLLLLLPPPPPSRGLATAMRQPRVALLGCAWGGALAQAGAQSHGGPEGERRLVPKTVFSADRRLLVVVGLEGTGHHFFVALLKRKKNQGSSWISWLGAGPSRSRGKATGCNYAMGLACLLELPGNWNQWNLERQVKDAGSHKASRYGPVGAGWSPQFLTDASDSLKFAFDHNPGWIVAPNPYTTSWPNGHGSHEMRKSHMAPSVLLLAQAAEMAGADMRVIPMHRDAAELLLADCRHRHDLEGCPGQADTLATNAREYADQMRQLDPAFYAGNCIRYHDLDNITRGIQHALAGSRATLGEDIATAVRGAWRNKHRDPEERPWSRASRGWPSPSGLR